MKVYSSLPPMWCSGKESVCQRRRFRKCGVNYWVSKISWRGKWQPPSRILSGKSHEERSLVGYSPQDCKESDRQRAWITLTSLGHLAILTSTCFLKPTQHFSASPQIPLSIPSLSHWSLQIEVFLSMQSS